MLFIICSYRESNGIDMLNIFQLKNNYLFQINNQDIVSSIDNVIWVDIIQSKDSDYDYVQNLLNQFNINFYDLKNINNTNRFFYDAHRLHIRSVFFSNNDFNQIDNSIIIFIVYKNCLYTIRESKLPLFSVYQKSLHNRIFINGNAYELLLNLFEIKLDDLTNRIEYIYSNLEKMSSIIMNNQYSDEYNNVLSELTALENVGWKIHINLLDTERVVRFLTRKIKLSILQKQHANEILNDIVLLLPYNECVFQKISFLVQSMMGLINIEQNRIIKIFSIVFLPPTLIASSYGMNFDFMPELRWSFGYPSAIILMILTGLIPYLYFKHKHWL